MKRKILKFFLKWPTRLMLAKHKPTIIAVTGSVGKTSAKEAIWAVLKNKYFVWRSQKSYNTEIGLPLAVFQIENSANSWFGWVGIFLKMTKRLVNFGGAYPDFLILELGVDRPGDMAYLTSLISPEIAVLTAIGEVPVHIEFFSEPKAVLKEKARLFDVLKPSGFAVLNYDDSLILDIKGKIKAKVLTYGFNEGADIQATSFQINSFFSDKEKAGISFKINYRGSFVPVHLKNLWGKSSVYAALAGAACGIALGMNLVEVSEVLADLKAGKGRLNLMRGIKNSWIFDDTYNASPASVLAALEVLKNLDAKRDILVLGDMKELGKYSEAAHRNIGKFVCNWAGSIWTLGDQAKLIGEEAVANGLDPKSVFNFEDTAKLGKALQDEIREGDLVLIKGSQAMRMEKIVKEVMAEPEKAKDVLVRQESWWKTR